MRREQLWARLVGADLGQKSLDGLRLLLALDATHVEPCQDAMLIGVHVAEPTYTDPIINFETRDSGLLHAVQHVAPNEPWKQVASLRPAKMSSNEACGAGNETDTGTPRL